VNHWITAVTMGNNNSTSVKTCPNDLTSATTTTNTSANANTAVGSSSSSPASDQASKLFGFFDSEYRDHTPATFETGESLVSSSSSSTTPPPPPPPPILSEDPRVDVKRQWDYYTKLCEYHTKRIYTFLDTCRTRFITQLNAWLSDNNNNNNNNKSNDELFKEFMQLDFWYRNAVKEAFHHAFPYYFEDLTYCRSRSAFYTNMRWNNNENDPWQMFSKSFAGKTKEDMEHYVFTEKKILTERMVSDYHSIPNIILKAIIQHPLASTFHSQAPLSSSSSSSSTTLPMGEIVDYCLAFWQECYDREKKEHLSLTEMDRVCANVSLINEKTNLFTLAYNNACSIVFWKILTCLLKNDKVTGSKDSFLWCMIWDFLKDFSKSFCQTAHNKDKLQWSWFVLNIQKTCCCMERVPPHTPGIFKSVERKPRVIMDDIQRYDYDLYQCLCEFVKHQEYHKYVVGTKSWYYRHNFEGNNNQTTPNYFSQHHSLGSENTPKSLFPQLIKNIHIPQADLFQIVFEHVSDSLFVQKHSSGTTSLSLFAEKFLKHEPWLLFVEEYLMENPLDIFQEEPYKHMWVSECSQIYVVCSCILLGKYMPYLSAFMASQAYNQFTNRQPTERVFEDPHYAFFEIALFLRPVQCANRDRWWPLFKYWQEWSVVESVCNTLAECFPVFDDGDSKEQDEFFNQNPSHPMVVLGCVVARQLEAEIATTLQKTPPPRHLIPRLDECLCLREWLIKMREFPSWSMRGYGLWFGDEHACMKGNYNLVKVQADF